MRLHHLFAVSAAAALSACAVTPASPADPAGTLRFSGTVQTTDTGCYVDGVCTATVDGTVVTTMSGERLNNPVWGQPNSLPAVGQKVAVFCAHTGPKACTLKGSTSYYLRVLP